MSHPRWSSRMTNVNPPLPEQLLCRVINRLNTPQNSSDDHGVDVDTGTTLDATSDSSRNSSALPPEQTSWRHSRVRHALSQLCSACGFDNDDKLLLAASGSQIARVASHFHARFYNARCQASAALYLRSSLF